MNVKIQSVKFDADQKQAFNQFFRENFPHRFHPTQTLEDRAVRRQHPLC